MIKLVTFLGTILQTNGLLKLGTILTLFCQENNTIQRSTRLEAGLVEILVSSALQFCILRHAVRVKR